MHLIALRPEAVTIEPAASSSGPDSVLATVEQIVYHNGETPIVFPSIRPGSDNGAPVVSGARVLARWTPSSNRVVRDDPH
jgi:hypothetical protein